MIFAVNFNGRRYSVKFFRTGLPSEVKVRSERGLWLTQWNSFSKRNPSSTLRKVIDLATHLREAKLAFEPRFPLID